LSSYLDRFQTWLSDSRNTPHPSFVFAIFNGLATFLDNLVSWFTTFFEKLTWVGTVALGTLVVVRFGHWRQAIGVLAAFASFALMGLWEESVQTFALVFAAVGLSLLVGVPLGVIAGRSNRILRFLTPLLAVNQTILFALSMVVIAGLIGGAGLGDLVTNGLDSNPALALLGGAAIVIMSIALDRSTESMAYRTDPARRHLTDEKKLRLRLFTLASVAG